MSIDKARIEPATSGYLPMIVTETQLAKARKNWEQACKHAEFENVARALLRDSRGMVITSFTTSGMSAAAANRVFNKRLETHSKRCIATLRELSKASDKFGSLLKKHKAGKGI